jgi:endonuclease YncB( thermonuclease family)
MGESRLALAALVVLLCASSPSSLTGRAERVIDGDSLEVETGGSITQVRLFGIDCPERDQPYADQARDELARIVRGKSLRLEVVDRDDYGRTVARVFVGDVDVNLALVRAGAAWVYRKYSKDRAFVAAEENARSARRGLWAADAPVAPWDWRHRRMPASGTAFSCSGKRYCREMTSCAEARFYLRECGRSSLDGDRDGVPCETLCSRGE